MTIPFGWQEKFISVPEGSYGVIQGPAAPNAMVMRILESEFTGDAERMPRDDKNYTRSQIEQILGRFSATWRVRKYLMPHGNPGDYPNDSNLLRAGFGYQASTGGSQVQYTLKRENDESLTLWRGTDKYAEAVYGAVVNEIEFRVGGGDFASVEYRGLAKKLIHTGTGTLSSSGATGATTIEVASFDSFSVGSFIQVGTSDASGQGHKVTAIDRAAGTLTIDPGLDSEQGAGVEIKPFWPSLVTYGSPIPGISGKMEIAGTEFKIRTGTVTLTQNLGLVNDEFGTDSASDILNPALREVNFSFEMLHRTTRDFIFGQSLLDLAQQLKLTIGTATGKTVELLIPKAKFNRPPVTIPEKDAQTLALSGIGLMTDGEDELILTIK